MRKLHSFGAIASALLIFGGCASAPSEQQLATADYGAPPRDYERVIHEYFDATLKDPASIQYKEVTEPRKDWVRDAPIAGYQMHYGWIVKATINAKNSYGGYVGFKTYSFLFRGEQIIETITPDTLIH